MRRLMMLAVLLLGCGDEGTHMDAGDARPLMCPLEYADSVRFDVFFDREIEGDCGPLAPVVAETGRVGEPCGVYPLGFGEVEVFGGATHRECRAIVSNSCDGRWATFDGSFEPSAEPGTYVGTAQVSGHEGCASTYRARLVRQ